MKQHVGTRMKWCQDKWAPPACNSDVEIPRQPQASSHCLPQTCFDSAKILLTLSSTRTRRNPVDKL